MPLPPGTRLGAYEITTPIGAGGMGEVYQAHDARLRRTVAIKILPSHLATPDRLERFEQEARAASTLNHPNILTIHDVGRDGDTAWFAMEFVDGQTLRDILNAGPIPIKRAVDLARQIAEGLAKAHASGIVHRDLKPENVMVTGDGLAKIVDFGIAKAGGGVANAPLAAESTMTGMAGTRPGDMMGTIGYMSPEQASGRAVDYRADQFALGLLIYELVTRTRPFERATTAQSIVATLEADPPPMDVLNTEVPPHLAGIVARLLAKDPAERYDSSRDLARDLGSVLEGLTRRTSAHDTAVIGTSGSAPPLHGWARAAVAAVVVLTIAVAFGWYLSRRAAAPPQQTAAEADRPLIAVRPFRSLSADPQQGYFAAGMTEEIRGQLSQVSAVRVLSGTGLEGYGDDLPRAARELGLRSFVDGSVRVEGNRVRVSAELVDARTRESIWSQQYERELAGVLAVQSDIAQRIANALEPNLSEAQRARLAKQPTSNLEAYTLYLRSRELPSTNRARNLEAIDMLKQALALDPTFAEAKARAAYRLVFMGYYDDQSWIDKGIAEAEAALRIDPELPFGYFTLGTGYAMKGQGARSRQAFLRALELNPSGGGLLSNFSIAELQYGRLDEAVYLGRRGFLLSGKRGFYHLIQPIFTIRADAESRILLEEAERRVPTDSRVQMMLGMLELLEGQVDKARARATAIAEREPNNLEMSFHRADIAYLTDDAAFESLMAPLAAESPTNHSVWESESVRMRYAYALQRRGESARAKVLAADAERYARERIAVGDDTPVQRIELAAGAALRGDTDAAIQWLERALEAGYREYGFLERDPIFRPLGSHPGFVSVLDRMRRDVEVQRERARTRGLLELQSLIGAEPQKMPY